MHWVAIVAVGAAPAVLVLLFWVPSFLTALRYTSDEYQAEGLSRANWLTLFVASLVISATFVILWLVLNIQILIVVGVLGGAFIIAVCSFWLTGPRWKLNQTRKKAAA